MRLKKITLLTTVGLLCSLGYALAQAQTQPHRNAQQTASGSQPGGQASEAKSFDEYNAVAEALRPYIESAKSGDGNLSRSAFLDHAHIVGSINGEFINLNADDFKKSINEGGPSPNVRHRIVWIDISGPAAAARVEFIDWSGFRFTDLFVLYKADGHWKISGKVFNSHTKN